MKTAIATAAAVLMLTACGSSDHKSAVQKDCEQQLHSIEQAFGKKYREESLLFPYSKGYGTARLLERDGEISGWGGGPVGSGGGPFGRG